ncbi:hypothetical protein [Streptomyces litmocidini]|uniref:Uncharacterized protein n=1 Tax=Streptomyces litmocidini TaxID=67318 RepID=A0ABW7UB02_9ACTN
MRKIIICTFLTLDGGMQWRGPRSDPEPHPSGDPACPAIQWTTERDGRRSPLVPETHTVRE